MIKIIVNPTAGGGSAVDHASTLARACADAGISVHVHVAANRDDSVRTAMETAPRGLVVACGGWDRARLLARGHACQGCLSSHRHLARGYR